MKDREVFVIATVNTPDNLPESLCRVGRFDRIIRIDVPGSEDAEKITAHYLKGKNCLQEVNPHLV